MNDGGASQLFVGDETAPPSGVRASDAHASLDYRFAWRWLVPSAGGTMRLVGFGEEDAAFLTAAVARPQAARGADAPLWLVDADAAALPAAGPRALAGADSVCVVGGRATVEAWSALLEESGFEDVRAYGLLPGSSPRLVVPLRTGAHTRAALRLHAPGRLGARAGVRIAELLSLFGIDAPLRRRMLLVATRQRTADPASDYALYLGAPGPCRKTVVLPLGRRTPVLLLKVGSSRLARAAVRAEHHALSELARTSVASFVPAPRGIVEGSSAVTLYQEYRPRTSSRRAARADVARFLGALAGVERAERSVEAQIASLGVAVELPAALRAWLLRHGRRLAIHRGHGDFAPWNVSRVARGLFVYDWEESRPDALAFADAFRYVTAPAVLAPAADPRRVVAACLSFGEEVAFAAGLDAQSVAVHLALFCIERLPLHPLYERLLAALVAVDR